MIDNRDFEIISFIQNQPGCSSKEIYDKLTTGISYATLKRILVKLASENLIISKGQGKGTKYFVSSAFELLQSIDIDKYYQKEIDERMYFSICQFNNEPASHTTEKAESTNKNSAIRLQAV